MAKITVTMDTESKKLDVAIDGKSVADVDGISIYNYTGCCGDDEKHTQCSISTSKSEENGVRVMTSYYAGYTEEAQAALTLSSADVLTDIPEFVGLKKTDPTQAIGEFLLGKVRR